MDTACYADAVIPPYYDSLIAKMIAHGRDRAEAIARMQGALDGFVVEGIKTTIPLQKRILADPDFMAGKFDTHFLERSIAVPVEIAGMLTAFPPLYAILDVAQASGSEMHIPRDAGRSRRESDSDPRQARLALVGFSKHRSGSPASLAGAAFELSSTTARTSLR